MPTFGWSAAIMTGPFSAGSSPVHRRAPHGHGSEPPSALMPLTPRMHLVVEMRLIISTASAPVMDIFMFPAMALPMTSPPMIMRSVP